MSALQLQRHLDIGSYQTAWRILNKIRTAMGDPEVAKFFTNIVEVDETYVGGKPVKNSKNKRGRGTDKTPVVGIFDRDNKQVSAKVVFPNQEGKNLTAKQLIEVIDSVTGKKTNLTIMTDEFRSYIPLKRTSYTHKVIKHKERYAIGDIHTNNIENFWGILKRGVYGVYHSISKKYLQDYINEFCFRYNHRDNGDVFNLLLERAVK
jgi:transposase-like protein